MWRSLEAGGSIALAPFDIGLPHFLSVVKPTIASLVPTMVYRLLRADPDVLASLRFILVGGARVPRALLEQANAAGVSLVRSYGSTESTSQIATSELGGDAVAAHVGPPLDGVDVTIVDDHRMPVMPGVTGHITVSGHIVSPGYLGEPDRVGPLVTGDLGSLDHSGRLTVLGRIDDRIVSGGENVFLSTVSETVRSIEGVDDAVAVGLPDDEWGTSVAVVVATSRPVAMLDSRVREVLSPHEVPKHWAIVDAIPTLPNGKHDLVAIRQIASLR
jgi:O-succinylbenzoic acid--CoA ligase